MHNNSVIIIGSPNVGKSTLFNRFTKSYNAIVSNLSETTRDIKYGNVFWNNKIFKLYDTGGLYLNTKKYLNNLINKQVLNQLNICDIILFLLDIQNGIRYIDIEIAKLLKNYNKKIFIVLNKVDSNKFRYEVNDFYSMGISEKIFKISAINGNGTGELLDEICQFIHHDSSYIINKDLPKFTIVGKPNVGKSLFMNILTNNTNSIVYNMPGTTRDIVTKECKIFGYHFILLDTAGMRKKSHIYEKNIEYYSNIRAIKAINDSDVIILIIDSTIGITQQDIKIIELAANHNKGILIASNKWDLINDLNYKKSYLINIKATIKFYHYIPIICISVINKYNMSKVINQAYDIYSRRKNIISTSRLNNILLPIVSKYPPASLGKKIANIKYITQLKNNYSTFIFFSSNSKIIKNSYKKFLENKIRENFNYLGISIKILIKEK